MNEQTYLEQKKETMGENLFMKKLLKKRLNQKGLTLIELLAVIVILAIVAAIAVPAIGNLIENSRVGAIKGDALNVLSSANIYFTENQTADTVDLTALTTGGYLETVGSLTSAEVTKVSGASNTIIAVGSEGGVTINFGSAAAGGVTADQINDIPNSSAAGAGNITISR